MRERATANPLSEREQQLMRFAAEGFTDTAIANKLGISAATVGTYWGRIRIKMGPFGRTELVGKAIKMEAEATMEKLKEDNHRLSQQLQSEIANGKSSDLYFELLKSAPNAVFVVSTEGLIEFANDSACELFGYALDELLGQHISMLLPERIRDIHKEYVEDYFWRPTKRKMGEHLDTLAVNKDGEEFPIAASINTVMVDGVEHAICMHYDVTDERLLRHYGSLADRVSLE